MRVLLIDDEPFYYKLIKKTLNEAEYELEYAQSGNDGLSKIPVFNPELLIVDLKLPGMDGFQVLERLRRDTKFTHIPVIVITAQDELSEKLRAFELGADDYLVKPFQPEELVARMAILARRGKAMQIVQQMETKSRASGSLITVHSLRGGLGCSSVVVNLGLAFYKIWGKQTLLVDGVLTAGQVALMLDAKPSATWENLVGVEIENIDEAVVGEMMCAHKSGVRYIASPRYPIAADTFSQDTLKLFVDGLRSTNDFILVDTSHDFSDMAIHMLSMSSTILLVMAPEMASLRTTMGALEIYDRGQMAEIVGRTRAPDPGGAVDHTLLTLQVESVDETYESLKSKGVQFDVPPTDRPDWGARTAHFRDPDGNLIEVSNYPDEPP